jgi:hypothetical protein
LLPTKCLSRMSSSGMKMPLNHPKGLKGCSALRERFVDIDLLHLKNKKDTVGCATVLHRVLRERLQSFKVVGF